MAAAQGPPVKDPFVPGLRWIHASETATPWIPRDACFVGDGELLWTAPAHQNPGLRLLSTAEQGTALPLCSDPVPSGVIGPIRVAAGDTADELFAVAQFPAPTSTTRRSEVTRHDALAAARGAGFAPVWTADLGLLGNGPARIAASPDGEFLVAAALDATTQIVRVVALDPSGGSERFRVDLPGSGLSALALSEDGRYVALAAGNRVWVLNGTGGVAWQTVLPGAVGTLDLAANGGVLAFGSGPAVDVRLLQSDGTYASAFTRTRASTEVVVALDLAADGGTLAAAWWDFTTGVDVRVEVLDTVTQGVVNTYAQTGGATVQNFPSALGVTPDGGRIVVGLWGAGDTRPELVLLDRTDPVPLLEADLPGSVYAAALDPDGTRVAAAAKDAHANLFSSAGEVRLYDTGERDLQLLAAARPGGSVELLHAMPEDGLALFALGFALDRPTPFKGQALWIDWARPHLVRPGAVGSRRASLSVDLAPDASLVGLPLAVQAATLGSAGVTLSATLVRLPVL